MKTVKITETFDGYPGRRRETFTAGEEREVSNEFADLIVGKGLAREVEAEKPAAPAAQGKGARA